MSTYVDCIFFNLTYYILEVKYMHEHTLNSAVVGRVIAEFRNRKGLSQEVVSGLADIGRTHLSAIEHGKRKPTLETLYSIACALDVNMSDIIIEIEKEIESQD